MKKLNRFGIAAVFTLMLASAAFAGEIGIGIAPPPTPPASSSVTTSGDIYIGRTDTDTASASCDSVSNIALNLLQSLLSVF
jgi:hypothetical protein